MGGQAGAGNPVGVMQEGRAIHAHPHVNVIALEAVAPSPIDHGGIGLQRLDDRAGGQAAPRQQLAQARTGLVVEGDWRH